MGIVLQKDPERKYKYDEHGRKYYSNYETA